MLQSKHADRSIAARSYSIFVPARKPAALQQECPARRSLLQPAVRDLQLIVSLLLQKNTLWPEEFRASSETCYPTLIKSANTSLKLYKRKLANNEGRDIFPSITTTELKAQLKTSPKSALNPNALHKHHAKHIA